MGLSDSKNIFCFEFPTFSSRSRAGCTATVTPLSTGENNSTGASRYRVISLSCFVRSRTRFRHFTVKRVSATSYKIEGKKVSRLHVGADTGEEDENVAYRLFTRRVFVVSGTFTRWEHRSMTERSAVENMVSLCAARVQSVSEFHG